MGTTQAGQKLRAHVAAFMSQFPIPASTPNADPPEMRDDGVLEFYKHWQVRGNEDGALLATYSDFDDVIEFGLTERIGDERSLNVLHATLVLEDAHGEFNVVSETRSSLNKDAIVTTSKKAALDAALLYFGDLITGRERSF